MNSFINTKKILITLLTISVIFKMSFLGKGLYSNQDENRYMSSQNAFEMLRKGEAKKATAQLFMAQARPGYVLFGMVPASAQIMLANYLKVSYNSESVLWVPYFFNFSIFLLILYFIYIISRRLGYPIEVSLFNVLFYSIFANSYLYIRHMFPYDIALLLLLMAFYQILEMFNNNHSVSVYLQMGIFMGFAYVTYPGYFQFVILLSSVMVMLLLKINKGMLFRRAIIPVTVFILIIFIFEFLSNYCHTSYLQESRTLSSTIVQGDFNEVPSFLFKYLIYAKFPTGIIFLFLLFVSIYILFKFKEDKPRNHYLIKLLLLMSFLVFSVFLVQGYFFHKMVLYGRLLHQYFPLLVIFISPLITIIFEKKEKYILVLGFLVFFSSFPNHLDYYNLHYAENITAKVSGLKSKYKNIIEYCDWDSCQSPIVIERDFKHLLDTSSNKTLVIQNWCYTRTDVMLNKNNYNYPYSFRNLLIDEKHWINMPAYQFEGAGNIQRKFFKAHPRRIRVGEL